VCLARREPALRLAASLLVVLLVLTTCQLGAAPAQIAITQVTIVDVHDGTAKPGMTVLVSGNRVAAVGLSRNVPIPAEARVIDGRGKFLIPGLWDMHVHSDGDERALRSMVEWGITGARDMAGELTKLKEARRRIDQQEWTGPHLLIAGPRLVGPPAEADQDLWVVHSPEEARHAIDFLALEQVDFIKVHDGLTRDTYLAIAESATRKGLPFVGHVPSSITPAEASDLGQKSIEHLEFVPKPCLLLFHPPEEVKGEGALGLRHGIVPRADGAFRTERNLARSDHSELPIFCSHPMGCDFCGF